MASAGGFFGLRLADDEVSAPALVASFIRSAVEAVLSNRIQHPLYVAAANGAATELALHADEGNDVVEKAARPEKVVTAEQSDEAAAAAAAEVAARLARVLSKIVIAKSCGRRLAALRRFDSVISLYSIDSDDDDDDDDDDEKVEDDAQSETTTTSEARTEGNAEEDEEVGEAGGLVALVALPHEFACGYEGQHVEQHEEQQVALGRSASDSSSSSSCTTTTTTATTTTASERTPSSSDFSLSDGMQQRSSTEDLAALDQGRGDSGGPKAAIGSSGGTIDNDRDNAEQSDSEEAETDVALLAAEVELPDLPPKLAPKQKADGGISPHPPRSKAPPARPSSQPHRKLRPPRS